jgi:hypothetical protein
MRGKGISEDKNNEHKQILVEKMVIQTVHNIIFWWVTWWEIADCKFKGREVVWLLNGKLVVFNRLLSRQHCW